jgi:hypothetical protein
VLDRSEYPNLFDPDRPAVVGDEPQPDTGEPTQPQPLRVPPRVSRPCIPSLAGRVALPGVGVRRLLRFAPVAILLALLLMHPAGCGRSTVTTRATRGVTAATSLAPRVTAAQMPARRSHAAPRLVTHAPHRPPAPVRRLTVTASRAPRAPASAQVASRAPAPARVLHATPAPSDPTPPSVAAPREAGGEFGFER